MYIEVDKYCSFFDTILQVHIKRSVTDMESEITSENDHSIHMSRNSKPPVIRKGKLVVVDLAGSERVHKSGVYQVSLILDSYKPKRSYLDMT